ncbi:MAG: DUF998 domain-containing protein [Actinomycetota bacterium]
MASTRIAEPTRSEPPPVTERSAPSEAARPRELRIAGLLLSLAGIGILMGSITAEALYPGRFSTHTNTLSHLGASEPPNSVVLQPSAAIFDITMVVTGAMIVAAAWFLHRALGRKGVTVPLALLGIGVFGVGVFPLNHLAPHTIFALLAFVAGGVGAILASRIAEAPFRGLWTILGVVSLVAITLGIFFLEWGPVAALGEGGIERWNAYPVVLWLVAFGSYLIAKAGGPLGGSRGRPEPNRRVG